MQVFFQPVGIEIPFAVKVLCGKPVGTEDLLYGRTAHAPQEHRLELVVGQTERGSAAEVVEASPELFRDTVLADIGADPAGVLEGAPFQHSAQGNVTGYRVVGLLEQVGVEHAGLADGYPALQSRFGEDQLCQAFGYRVPVVDAGVDGIAAAAPVPGRQVIAHLGHRTDVHRSYIVRAGLGLDGPDDVLRALDIDLKGTLRIHVRSR